jgi:acyl-phosphate glycerol 3-phosphate acyltransferase
VLTERDVREEGSGRTGGTNAYRAGGFLGGFLTIVGDFLKGMCAVAFGALMLPNIWAPVLSGLGGVLGHNASIFLAFHGGAGTISSMGAVTAFWPPALLFIAPVFVLGMFVIRIASVASIIMNSGVVVLFLVLVLFGGYPWRYYRAVVNDDFEHYIDKYYQYWQRLIPNTIISFTLLPHRVLPAAKP